MATKKIMLRLNDLDPTEAEIMAILHTKADGRKAPWLRDVLVAGYQALRAVGGSVQLLPACPSPVITEPAKTDGKKKRVTRSDVSRSQNKRTR